MTEIFRREGSVATGKLSAGQYGVRRPASAPASLPCPTATSPFRPRRTGRTSAASASTRAAGDSIGHGEALTVFRLPIIFRPDSATAFNERTLSPSDRRQASADVDLTANVDLTDLARGAKCPEPLPQRRVPARDEQQPPPHGLHPLRCHRQLH
jgi:hypothetical protein